MQQQTGGDQPRITVSAPILLKTLTTIKRAWDLEDKEAMQNILTTEVETLTRIIEDEVLSPKWTRVVKDEVDKVFGPKEPKEAVSKDFYY